MKDAKTRPGADCNSDQQLLNVIIKLKLEKMTKSPHPMILDYKTPSDDIRVDVSNRFEALLNCDIDSKTPNELWEDGKQVLLSVVKNIISRKKKKKQNWISDETITQVEIRREMKATGVELQPKTQHTVCQTQRLSE